MAKLPEKINTDYLRGLNPATAAASTVAQTVNALIDYLAEQQVKLDPLIKSAEEVDHLEKQFKASSDE